MLLRWHRVGTDTEIRVSTEKKISCASCGDSNPRPSNHKSSTLTTELFPFLSLFPCKQTQRASLHSRQIEPICLLGRPEKQGVPAGLLITHRRHPAGPCWCGTRASPGSASAPASAGSAGPRGPRWRWCGPARRTAAPGRCWRCAGPWRWSSSPAAPGPGPTAGPSGAAYSPAD